MKQRLKITAIYMNFMNEYYVINHYRLKVGHTYTRILGKVIFRNSTCKSVPTEQEINIFTKGLVGNLFNKLEQICVLYQQHIYMH